MTTTLYYANLVHRLIHENIRDLRKIGVTINEMQDIIPKILLEMSAGSFVDVMVKSSPLWLGLPNEFWKKILENPELTQDTIEYIEYKFLLFFMGRGFNFEAQHLWS